MFSAPFPIATAMRRTLLKGYGAEQLRADLMAGAVVGIVALPLSMALAIAVGAPPQHGLYTAIVAGTAVALLGGCKFQVTGPTAAFVVILAPVLTNHGLSGLLTAGFLAGLILVAMGLARMGALIRFIPYPVTTGFTTGIAAVIATLQLKDVFGLEVGAMPERYHEKVLALWEARGSFDPGEAAVAGVTLALLLGIPRVVKRIPAPLLALGGTSIAVAALHLVFPTFEVATIGSRFAEPLSLPSLALPWGSGLPSFALIESLLPAAFTIAMLGAIESLLSAVIADGMTGTRHDPNAELVGLGIGNLLAPLFGGIAATGALARTATNIRSGARSPIAAVVHAVVLLLAIVLLSPAMAYVPMASLAALLLVVAWNMSEVRHFLRLTRIAPKSDILVLVTCFLLTVFFDMVVAVSVGFVLAAVLFMRRMAEITDSHLVLDDGVETGPVSVPTGASLYQINGPLFFGAAQSALDTLAATNASYRVLILDLSRVPVIDATGFVALESAILQQRRAGRHVVLVGPLPRPHVLFERAGVLGLAHVRVALGGLDEAVELARALVEAPAPDHTSTQDGSSPPR